MPTNINDNVYARTGETLSIEIVVRDSDGNEMVLIGASAKIGIRIGSSTTIKNCTILDSRVIATLTDEETTALNGNYKYEIVLETADGQKKSLAYGILVITESLINEILENSQNLLVPVPTNGSGIIPITGWVANNGFYPHKINIPIEGIISTHILYLVVDQDDLSIAETAQLAPSCDSYNGGITLYSVDIPLQPIGFSFILIGGIT